MPVTVNGILKPFLQAACSGDGVMVRRFFHRFWNANAWPAGERADRTITARNKRKREEQAALERQKQQQLAEKKEHQERDDAEFLTLALLVSEECRRSYEALSNDLADARTALTLAYERALLEQQRAYEALEELRQDPSGEDYRHALAEVERAQEETDQLATLMLELDELRERAEAGQLSPDELAQAQDDLQAIIHAMPSEVREDYEGLRAIRKDSQKPAYRAADPAALDEAAPNLAGDFQRAGKQALQPGQDEIPDAAPPAYRPAPDFLKN